MWKVDFYMPIGARLGILRQRAKYILQREIKTNITLNLCTCNFTKQCTFWDFMNNFFLLWAKTME